MGVKATAAAALAAGAIVVGVLTAANYEPVAAQSTIGFNAANLSQADGLGHWVSVCEGQAHSEPYAGVGCYMQFIDVAEPGKLDGSIAAFVIPERNGLRVEFNIADGLSFENGEFYLARDGFPIWNLRKYDCLESGVCTFSGPAAEALVNAFSDNDGHELEMRIHYTDSSGSEHDRSWPMLSFASAYDGFNAQRIESSDM